MCFLSVYVLFLGCYVSLVHTQWAWNPVGMCLIWKFYPLGLVNSNRRLRTVLQCRQECGNGKSSVQRHQRAQVAVLPVLEGATVLEIRSLKLLCFLLCSVSAGKWGLGQLCFPLYPQRGSLAFRNYSLPRSAPIPWHAVEQGAACLPPLLLKQCLDRIWRGIAAIF